ncbi:Hpt domain-containing protein [Motiliproteus sp. MSK22-1]|uniref:Hpt domain-containing protein n=1 Tax=Motiliproteus sp. MSK22-1 TaxID=1897630 RepID=UPI00097818A7|nr:Hpt domain-containing protein [Motiliproteus sp. MSK22-1]OMH32705.1 hypothetical protein BGP75_14320 [Motiliproteus sp. MSK22-1]
MDNSTLERNRFSKEQLEKLNAQFLERVETQIEAIGLIIKNKTPRLSTADLQTAQQLLHTLSGAGGTFGFSELSQAARTMEQTVKHWLYRKEAPSPDERAQFEKDAVALAQTLKKGD